MKVGRQRRPDARIISTGATPPASLLLAGFGVDVLKCKRGVRNHGCHHRDCVSRPIWTRHPAEVLELYQQARSRYRQMMKEAHPDKGGSEEAAKVLNDRWAKLERIFTRKGYALTD